MLARGWRGDINRGRLHVSGAMLGVLLWGAMLYNAHAQLAQARNGTTYQASRDTPSVLLVGDVALPLSARIEALALGRD